MSVPGNRKSALAVLLLATITFAGVVTHGHQHDSLSLATGHEDLPTVSAGHAQPDHTVHIEAVERIESASCVGCLQRKRQRAAGLLQPTLVGFQPSATYLVAESPRLAVTDARRLPASRAPPRA